MTNFKYYQLKVEDHYQTYRDFQKYQYDYLIERSEILEKLDLSDKFYFKHSLFSPFPIFKGFRCKQDDVYYKRYNTTAFTLTKQADNDFLIKPKKNFKSTQDFILKELKFKSFFENRMLPICWLLNELNAFVYLENERTGKVHRSAIHVREPYIYIAIPVDETHNKSLPYDEITYSKYLKGIK